MKSCCCGFTLQAGGIASAWYTIVFELFFGLGQILLDAHQERGQQIHDVNLPGDDLEDSTVDKYMVTNNAAIVHFTLLITAGVMLFGILQNRASLLMPWVVWNSIMMGALTFELVGVVAAILNDNVLTNGKLSVILALLIGFIVLFVNIYCIVCVISLHFEMLRSKTLGDEENPVWNISCSISNGEAKKQPKF